MQNALNYSGTRFLSTENQNYSMSWRIPSLKLTFRDREIPPNAASGGFFFFEDLNPEGLHSMSKFYGMI